MASMTFLSYLISHLTSLELNVLEHIIASHVFSQQPSSFILSSMLEVTFLHFLLIEFTHSLRLSFLQEVFPSFSCLLLLALYFEQA